MADRSMAGIGRSLHGESKKGKRSSFKGCFGFATANTKSNPKHSLIFVPKPNNSHKNHHSLIVRAWKPITSIDIMVVNSAVVLIQALRLGFKAGLNGRPPPPAPANLPRSIFLNSLKRSIRLPSSSSSTVTNSVNSNSTSIKLSFKFNALLNQLNPIFRGFGNVFRSHPSTSNYSSSPILNNLNNLRSSAKSGFTASRSSIRGSGLRPSFRPSVSHGPGLQLARNFSSTGSSFGLIINNSL